MKNTKDNTQSLSVIFEKIAKHMGMRQERLKSGDYLVRYRKEHGIAQSRPKNEFKIDTKHARLVERCLS